MKTKSKIFGSILVITAMLFAGMEALAAPQAAYAADSATDGQTAAPKTGKLEVKLAKYFSTDAKAVCSQDKSSAQPYSGTLKADIPLATAMSDFSDKLPSIGFPWDETKTTDAYIYYTLTFPSNVVVDSTDVSVTSNLIKKNVKAPVQNGNSYTFALQMNEDWPTIKRNYAADKAKEDAGAKTVSVSIRYHSTSATSEKQYITGSGKLDFWTGRSFFSVKTHVGVDESSPMKVEAADFTKAGCPSKPAPLPEGETTADLTADLLGSVDGSARDTAHNYVLSAQSKKSVFSVTGTLHVNDLVKGQMGEVIKKYNETPELFSDIALSKVKFSFDAKLTLPQELKFTTADAQSRIAAQLEGAPGFEVKSSTVSADGKTVNITIGLKNPESITDFARLKSLIDSLDKDLSVTVGGITFTDDAKPDTDYTIEGAAGGKFSASATQNGVTHEFAYSYTAAQKPDEADSVKPNALALTVNYVKAVPMDLPSDLLGAETGKTRVTEHDEVYTASSRKSVLTMSGALHVRDIVKKQMKEIEEKYGQASGGFEKIGLSNVDYGFTATLTLPEGMEYSDTDISKITLEGAPGFEISQDPAQTFYKGRTVTVHFSLKSKIVNYRQLSDTIKQLQDTLYVNVPGVRFAKGSKANTNYTVKGTVSGAFSARATLSGRTIPFAFEWTGVQQPDEADAAAPEGINFTVKYRPEVKPRPQPKPEPKKNVPATPSSKKQDGRLARTGSGIIALMFAATALAGAGITLTGRRRSPLQ